MFFFTNPRLLSVLHSLLARPTTFRATESLDSRLHALVSGRPDISGLRHLCMVYDEMRLRFVEASPSTRRALEVDVSYLATPDTNAPAFDVKLSLDPIVERIPSSQLWACESAQRQLDRLVDHFALRESGSRNPLTHDGVRDAVRFYMLSEALAFCIAGLASADVRGDVIRISASGAPAQRELRRSWFASWVDKQSSLARLGVLKSLRNVPHGIAIPLLTQDLMDRELSVKWSELDGHAKKLKTMQRMYDVASLVSALEFEYTRSALGLSMCAPYDACLASEVISQLKDFPVHERFLVSEGKIPRMRWGARSYGLRAYYVWIAKMNGEVESLRRCVGGESFEKELVKRSLESSDYSGRYQVTGELRREHAPGVENEMDVDMIIHDHRLDHYYFVQTKHTALGAAPYFESTVALLQNHIAHGLLQLTEAKRLFCEGQLQKVLADRGMGGARPENSSFVLVHNVPALDYQVSDDGVALYEWRSFRNLLVDCRVYASSGDGQFEEIYLKTPVPLGSPDVVIANLFRHHQVYQGREAEIWAGDGQAMTFVSGRWTVELNGLGL